MPPVCAHRADILSTWSAWSQTVFMVSVFVRCVLLEYGNCTRAGIVRASSSHFSDYHKMWVQWCILACISCLAGRAGNMLRIPSRPGWKNGQRILWPSLTVLWPRIIMAKNGKKHLRHCNYDSVEKFELEVVGISAVILFFSDKN